MSLTHPQVLKTMLAVSLFLFLEACRDSVEDDTAIRQIANGIPVVEINTIDVSTVSSSSDYVKVSIIFCDCDDIVVEVGGKIRGRGNATWKDYPKKPYKIKFDESIGFLGFPPNRDRVLLAEYCDKSLLRTAYMCEVSKTIGMDYTIKYQHVDLVMNGEYLGTYVLTELIERDSNRINIDDDGYIIEDDFYYEQEPVFLKTKSGYTNTFKYPDTKDFAYNDERYAYIGTFLAKMEDALKLIPQDCET